MLAFVQSKEFKPNRDDRRACHVVQADVLPLSSSIDELNFVLKYRWYYSFYIKKKNKEKKCVSFSVLFFIIIIGVDALRLAWRLCFLCLSSKVCVCVLRAFDFMMIPIYLIYLNKKKKENKKLLLLYKNHNF